MLQKNRLRTVAEWCVPCIHVPQAILLNSFLKIYEITECLDLDLLPFWIRYVFVVGPVCACQGKIFGTDPPSRWQEHAPSLKTKNISRHCQRCPRVAKLFSVEIHCYVWTSGKEVVSTWIYVYSRRKYMWLKELSVVEKHGKKCDSVCSLLSAAMRSYSSYYLGGGHVLYLMSMVTMLPWLSHDPGWGHCIYETFKIMKSDLKRQKKALIIKDESP